MVQVEPQGMEDVFPSWDGGGDDVPPDVSGSTDGNHSSDQNYKDQLQYAPGGASNGDGHEVFHKGLWRFSSGVPIKESRVNRIEVECTELFTVSFSRRFLILVSSG